jgi:hypothetical protein
VKRLSLAAGAVVAAVLAGGVLLVWLGEVPQTPEERALVWLRAKQSPDGAWRSEIYGVMREGASLTAFLAWVTGDARALDWLAASVAADGSLGAAGDVKDYPNYATALALRAFARHRPREPAIARMIAHLRAAQFREPAWTPDQPHYGGWAYSAASTKMTEVKYLNVSVTSWVVEALAEAGVPADDAVFARAKTFLGRCRAGEAWQFTPLVDPLNKAGQGTPYASATADAAIATRAMGGDAGAAVEWLERRFTASRVPGLEGDFAEGLRFYWLARAAAILPSRRGEIRQGLVAAQRPDGSWANAQALMKEDDPLIATGLALAAMRAANGGGRVRE